MPEIIAEATRREGIANPQHGFLALFSKDPFPGATIELRWVRGDDANGNTYTWQGLEGWLCVALLRYFEAAPAAIHLQVRPVEAEIVGFDEWFDRRVGELSGLLDRWRGLDPDSVPPAVHAWLRGLAHDAWQEGRRHTVIP